ncbi:MAG: M23 family metallopeptidase [Ignavibacteriae bacterium]|nr:M23 family metallopeptidase [Ignavibacteriota bacterium]
MIVRTLCFLLGTLFFTVFPLTSGGPEMIDVSSNSYLKEFDSIRTDLNDYIWPTDVTKRITSSFAEYRTMHFHGGLDISTNGEVGHNIFSVRDGSLYRISIQPNGYGKMLFIKHNDGYYSVYVHLQKFSERIEQLARQEQLRKGAFPIDVTYETPLLQVKKGEVIAYSGESGVGPPHIHFEIRDENLNNVNPMLMYGDSLPDNIAPRMKSIALFPLEMNSTVDGKPSTKYMSRFGRGKGTFKIPQTIRVHGSVGFGIDAYDMANGSRNKSGIYRIELFLDNKQIFSKQLDRFPSLQTKQIYLDYDYPTILSGKGEYQRLYVEEGGTLPFYEHHWYGDGIINTKELTEGEHEYKIVCKDFTGNTSTLEGKFFVNHSPRVELLSVNDNKIVLKSDVSESLSKIIVSGKKLLKGAWTQSIIKKEKFQVEGSTIAVTVPTSKYEMLKIVAESKLGISSVPLYHFIKKPDGPRESINLKLQQTRDYVLVNVSTKGMFTGEPHLMIKEGIAQRDISLEQEGLSEFAGVFKPTNTSAGVHIIDVRAEINGLPVHTTETLELFAIPTNSSGSFSLGNDNLIISYDSGAVYKPMLLNINNQSTISSTKFSLTPTDIILNKGLKISVPVHSHQLDGKHGLYFRGNGGWVLHTNSPDPSQEYFTTTLTRTLGELTIMKDEQAPSIGRLRFNQAKGLVNGNFRYSDNLSGVDFDELKIFVDDQIIIPEIDGEKRRVWFQSTERLSAGKHTLTITMKDRMKNEAKLTKTFSVKASASTIP